MGLEEVQMVYVGYLEVTLNDVHSSVRLLKKLLLGQALLALAVVACRDLKEKERVNTEN